MTDAYARHLDVVERIYADLTVELAMLNEKLAGGLPNNNLWHSAYDAAMAARKKLLGVETDWYIAAPNGVVMPNFTASSVWDILLPHVGLQVADAYGQPRRESIHPAHGPLQASDLDCVYRDEQIARDLAASLNLGRMFRQGRLA